MMCTQPGVIRIVSARIPHAVCVKLGVKMLSEIVHENLKTLVPCPALDEAAASKLIAAIQSTEVLPAAFMVSAHTWATGGGCCSNMYYCRSTAAEGECCCTQY